MYKDLQKKANKIRLNTFKAISNAGGGHFGGSLSESEILTVLYFKEMRIDPNNPQMEDRDRFVISKGHGGPGLYATLAERGFFPKELLGELDKNGSRLPKHVDRLKLPGIDTSSGALGQGLSIGVGMAISSKIDSKDVRVYVLMGDGECDEGQIWEAAMSASKFQLDNLVGLVDRNFLQVDGTCEEIMPTEPLSKKWEAFGWHVACVDGHSVSEISKALNNARKIKGKPCVIIANTVKGKGVSFMEGSCAWHSGNLSPEQYEIAIEELEGGINANGRK